MPRKLTPEQAKKIREKRDAEDPCLHYVPPVTAARANECKARWLCLHSVNQYGKTAWMQYVTASVLRGKNKNWTWFGPCKILLVIPKRAQAAEVWGNRLLKACELFGPMGKFPWIPKREISKVYNSYSPAGPYPGKIILKNGSELVTILSGDPNSWKGLEGMTFDLVIRDEVAGSENLGDELQPRLLASRTRALAGLQGWGGIMLWAATETKHNEEWLAFKQRCIDGAVDHAYFRPDPRESDAYISMQARGEMQANMSAKSYRIRAVGDLDAGDLVRIFVQQWDDKRHMMPTDYVVRPDDNLHIAWDPGVEHPTGIVISAISRTNPGQIKVVKVFEHSNETVDYDVECMHSFLLGRRLTALIYDYAAKNSLKHAPSLLTTLIQKMDAKGIVPIAGYIQSDKRVDIGIETMRHYLDPEPFNKGAMPLLVLSPSQDSGGPLLRSEIMGYCKTEPTPTSKGKIVKKNDDALDCFPAGTMIATEFGERPIESVAVGDRVWTRKGLRRVTDAWETAAKPLVEMQIRGRSIRCTPEHLFWTENRGWVSACGLTQRDILVACQTSLPSTGSNTTREAELALDDSKTAVARSSTGTFGSMQMAQYQRVIQSITAMGTVGTMNCPTWNRCPRVSILGTMAKRIGGWLCSLKFARLLLSGMAPKKGAHGTFSTVLTPMRNERRLPWNARNAVPSSAPSTGAILVFAATTVSLHGEGSQGLMISPARAQSAVKPSCQAGTHQENDALLATPTEAAAVYDLTVGEEPEFFANGVLAHNCIRYQVRAFPHWSAAYQCGAPSFAVETPMESSPTSLNVRTAPPTFMEIRARLSQQMAGRNRARVMALYGPGALRGGRMIL